ncbi:MAG: adenylate/guanylate cyclase domain-containing protein [Treponema sp.]|nr:adenylate/guanylate cyclase domain-containing protein [Treponema sp.]MBR6193448.1 adenylate/guanylate cyclase domain-containing protein [Treponema sp.]
MGSSNKISKGVRFQKVGNTSIVPISAKILVVFIVLILLSCLSTNFITLVFTQRQTISLTNELLVYHLSDLYTNATNQYQISLYSQKRNESLESIEEAARRDFSKPHSIAMGVTSTGNIVFSARQDTSHSWYSFSDQNALAKMNEAYESAQKSGTPERVEGSVTFFSPNGEEYMGVFKYHSDWKCFLIRGELTADTNREMYGIFLKISIIILVMTAFFMVVGISVLNVLFSNVRKFTKDVYDLHRSQQLDTMSSGELKAPIDISDAPNDDITYLAANFNNLYLNTATLRNIFQKFVSKHVVDMAYNEKRVELKGEQRQLTILFTDIKNFTNRTEVLGNEIIRLLNIHYNSIIGIIQPDESGDHRSKAFIGSLIGDAVLGVFGIDGTKENVNPQKSVDAVSCAWKMTQQTKKFREKMIARKKELVDQGRFNDQTQRVFEAVMIDIGVGIDGGEVFYGNIGSNKYMANTVIGDNVNSASRIEGLTRIYKLPVLCSEYVKSEVLKVPEGARRYRFFEIDTVQVKGKLEGKKIFFPMDLEQEDADFAEYYTLEKFEEFEEGLRAYYSGDWKTARSRFKKSDMDVGKVFLDRMGLKNAPADWSGIWTMSTK